MSLPYDIEERVEDAFVQYLSLALSQVTALKVFPAFSTDVLQYPCVVVHAHDSAKIVPDGAASTSRRISVDIAILTEAANQLDDVGRVVVTARQRNANARGPVIQALSISDTDPGPADLAALVQADAGDMPTGLAAYLVYQKVPGVWIKFAQVREINRSVEPDKRCLVTTVSAVVVAQPVEIGGY